MSSADIYRGQAEELLKLSFDAPTFAERKAYLETAQFWNAMARQSEMLAEAVTRAVAASLAAA